MRFLRNPRVLIAATVLAALIAAALWPGTETVELATVARGPLVVTIDDEGRTRVRDRFVVSAPVTGRVLRIDLEPGDPVKRGDVVARLRPETPPLLDARTLAETRAAIESARAALGRARADEQRARTIYAQAERELARSRYLFDAGATIRRELDDREAEAALARDAVEAAAFAVRAATADLQRAEARLTPRAVATDPDVAVTAPADGVVLRRLRESESVIPAGEPLVEIGDPRRLEIVADLLSVDAVRVRPGARATVERWGQDDVLSAEVRRIEPAGFTKISALGVEEQRVNVILDFVERDGDSAALGDAYRVDVRIVVSETPDAVKVPTGALFRHGADWAVYIIDNGRARLRLVEIGRRTAREAEVQSGLAEGDVVVLHPGDRIADATRVVERPAAGRAAPP